ncbi:uncharacterized protein LAESUDRAFT_739492 [Laetiporus sulphureus 93-53]|uniref:C3H1-type domain-containing protein n=1 Tax=Laetiporus sulphureus 93-53 TaxID=1314785 RepID=A0A165BCP1_9APHY|nr:uncharacterized protein LAESUDRAFT_739492 [Laetiporus sulphureus 93-53]KZT00750.1 hypothetical protein LAESUDRAFT_739492 [Laetiporus sulphureus 93-53]
MPASDNRKEDESLHDSGRDIDRDKDREKGGKVKGPSKTKDLSHVPCKFFRVGSCTAGPSCPFSHAVLEPGQQKEVCAWFVKGNCKFGHKCALAHILPGQSMSMDRKNKKAAQLAANAANAPGGGGREGSRAARSQKSGSHGGSSSQSRNALLSGSTAPTRAVSSNSRSGIPMQLKTTLSPSTPAPPVKDTDFASFGLPDESNKLPSAPAQGKSAALQMPTDMTPHASEGDQTDVIKAEEMMKDESSTPSTVPAGTPIDSRRVGEAENGSFNAADFGPIGSPTHSSPSAIKPMRAHVNGVSPGTSPQTHGLSSSPFSAPGTQSVFVFPEQEESVNVFKSRSGISASLGAMFNWSADRPSPRVEGFSAGGMVNEIVVEDEDLEEFLPSSLTDLLTPEERSRRMSRTKGSRAGVLASERDPVVGQRPGSEGLHHKYSRSVPAPSLSHDIRSIWADSNDNSALDPAIASGGLGNGTPSSFQSNSALTGRPSGEDILAPSNASAAFLPGLHHHYLHAKTQRISLLSGMTPLHSASGNSMSHYSNIYGAGLSAGTMSPPRTNVLGNRTTLDTVSSDIYHPHSSLTPSGHPIQSRYDDFATEGDERHTAFSPSARALQAHAPGQSLPQGLAAGYSRIHALPPPPVIPSPSTPGAFSQAGGVSPGTKMFGHVQSASGDWHSMPSSTGNGLDHTPGSQTLSGQTASVGSLQAVFSRLSYSAAASSKHTSPQSFKAYSLSSYVGGATAAPRITSVRNANPPQGLSSPLSGPVLTGDDDDLFSMDG